MLNPDGRVIAYDPSRATGRAFLMRDPKNQGRYEKQIYLGHVEEVVPPPSKRWEKGGGEGRRRSF